MGAVQSARKVARGLERRDDWNVIVESVGGAKNMRAALDFLRSHKHTRPVSGVSSNPFQPSKGARPMLTKSGHAFARSAPTRALTSFKAGFWTAFGLLASAVSLRFIFGGDSGTSGTSGAGGAGK